MQLQLTTTRLADYLETLFLHFADTTEYIRDEGLCIMTDSTERVAEADLAGDVVKDGNSRDVCRIRSHVAVPSVQPKNTAQQKVSCKYHVIST